jgi:hypothetical protein
MIASNAIAGSEPMSEAAIHEALRHDEAGRLGETRALYRDILTHHPNHTESLHCSA